MSLLNENSIKTAVNNQGIVLLSHLYGRARDLWKAMPEEVINGKTSFDAIVSTIYKRDPLTVLSTIYGELVCLLSKKAKCVQIVSGF